MYYNNAYNILCITIILIIFCVLQKYLKYVSYIYIENQHKEVFFFLPFALCVGFRWRNSHFRAVQSQIFLALNGCTPIYKGVYSPCSFCVLIPPLVFGVMQNSLLLRLIAFGVIPAILIFPDLGWNFRDLELRLPKPFFASWISTFGGFTETAILAFFAVFRRFGFCASFPAIFGGYAIWKFVVR